MGVIRGGRLMTIPAGVLTVHAPRGAAAAAASWWEVAGKTCVAAYQPKGAASLAASYVNLATPGTNDAYEGTAPSWAAGTGWTFNGSTQYLKTGITPSRDQTWSMLIRYDESDWRIDDWESLCGSFSTAGGNSGFLWQGRNLLNDMRGAWSGTGTIIGTVVAPLNGVAGFAGKTTYMDGSSDLTISDGSAAGNHLELYIGGLNFEDTSIWQLMSGSILAIAIYSATLTAGEVATVSAAMAAL